jgi:hypothetical protein
LLRPLGGVAPNPSAVTGASVRSSGRSNKFGHRPTRPIDCQSGCGIKVHSLLRETPFLGQCGAIVGVFHGRL